MPQTNGDSVSLCKAFLAASSCSVRDWRSVAAASDSAFACVSFCAASLAAFLLASRLVLAAFCLACAALVRCSFWEPKLAMSAASSCHSSDQLFSSPFSMSIRSMLLCQCILVHCKVAYTCPYSQQHAPQAVSKPCNQQIIKLCLCSHVYFDSTRHLCCPQCTPSQQVCERSIQRYVQEPPKGVLLASEA